MAAPIHLEVLADLFNKIDPQETSGALFDHLIGAPDQR